MDEKTKIPAPVDNVNDGVSIHLSYIRRDIDEIKTNMARSNQDVKTALADLTNAYVTRMDFEEHLKADEDHEQRIRTVEKSVDTNYQTLLDKLNTLNVKIAWYIGMGIGGVSVIQFVITYFTLIKK